jgi:hypothetical protein
MWSVSRVAGGGEAAPISDTVLLGSFVFMAGAGGLAVAELDILDVAEHFGEPAGFDGAEDLDAVFEPGAVAEGAIVADEGDGLPGGDHAPEGARALEPGEGIFGPDGEVGGAFEGLGGHQG